MKHLIINKNRKYINGKTVTLAAVLAACGIGIGNTTAGDVHETKDYLNSGRPNRVSDTASSTDTSMDTDEFVEKLSDNIVFKEKQVYKNETVYAFADANGNADKVLVNEILKNTDGLDTLTDKTDLEGIVNIKGDETFSQDGDTITWQAGGNDIYYQGTTNKQLPVTVKVTYYLNGKEIAANALAGKSGNVTIRFDYINNENVSKIINGKTENIKVPFVAVTGMMLDEKFTNISVVNGKAIENGDNNIVIGYAMPGLMDSLGAQQEDFSDDMTIPEYVEVNADVENFSLDMTATIVVNASSVNMSGGFDFADMDDMVDTLSDASGRLVDGSGELADGTKTLLEKMGEFSSGIGDMKLGADELKTGLESAKNGVDAVKGGIDSVKEGADSLKGGADSLKDGVGSAKDGVDSLKDGVDSVKDGADSVKDGVDSVKDGADSLKNGVDSVKDGVDSLKSGIDLLAESSGTISDGVNTISNSAADINSGILALDAGLNTPMTDEERKATYDNAATMAQSTVQNSFAQGTDNYNSIYSQAANAFTSSMTGDVTINAVYDGLRSNADLRNTLYTATLTAQYQSVAASYAEQGVNLSFSEFKDNITEEQSTEIYAGVDAQLMNMTLQVVSQIAATGADDMAANVVAACETAAETAAGQAAGQAAVAGVEGTKAQIAAQIEEKDEKTGYSLVSGSSALAEGAKTLEENMPEFVGGISTIQKGAGNLQKGAGTLQKGAGNLQKGAGTLQKGAGTLQKGVGTLQKGTGNLQKGMSSLNAGAIALSEGAGTLKSGTEALQGGAASLQNGTTALLTGATGLSDGAAKIQDATGQLKEGVEELSSGAGELEKGMSQFDEEAIRKLANAYNKDIKELYARLEAVCQASTEYDTYTMLNEGDEGTTKFIIKTAGIQVE